MNKATLRRQYRQKRKALILKEVNEYSERIAGHFFEFLTERKLIDTSATIHTFLPIERQNEVNTWPIIRGIWAKYTYMDVVVPITDTSTTMLRHCLLSPQTRLAENSWGISEPAVEDHVLQQPADIDIVLVPLLSFDQLGHRVGYGGGYYDRFLAECQPGCLNVGLSLFEPIDRIDDIEPTDIRLDMCITPEHVWIF